MAHMTLIANDTNPTTTGNEPTFVGSSAPSERILDMIRRVAPSNANVFLFGESGSGKEVVARTIHLMSPRSHRPFIAINCSAIPEHLLESELFGHTKGAFSGATEVKLGLMEEARGGTLFLDEIGDMSPQLQAKLLRVIQERKVRRVGENQQRPIDVRIISATHRDLPKEIKEHHFREDLFFRLKVISISLPPLRDRRDDILSLADLFLKKFSEANHVSEKRFSESAIQWMLQNKWRGNVRELQNSVERAVILSRGQEIEIEDLCDSAEEDASPMEGVSGSAHSTYSAAPAARMGRLFNIEETITIDSLVKKYIQFVLDRNHGARDKTAKDLAIDRKTLYRKLHEIESDQFQQQT